MNSNKLDEVTIRFAGDSGDGMQLTGSQFTNTTAMYGNDLSTFPDFPAEIRAPQGTVAGVSGFQIHFGSKPIYNIGDNYDVLVVMNVAALKANVAALKPRGILIADEAGFDLKNMRLAKVETNPLEDGSLSNFQVFRVDITKLTKEALKDSGLSSKEIDRSKNMFVLGLLYWLYHRSFEATINKLKTQFAKKPEIAEANILVLKAGWNFGETAELFHERYDIQPAIHKEKGNYRNITGNNATAIGLIAAAQMASIKLFYGSYPITPASDILHELAKHKNFDVITFQAEDEIAAITSAIGASYGGSLGVTASSGPGIALKQEAMGLAIMLELPLVICNVQRGGPSTGLPTKTEQSDLMQALYGRNGEAPIVVVAPATPSECFDYAFMASKIAIEHMTPVMFLSDAALANGAEPWKYPSKENLQRIETAFAHANDQYYQPYKRNEKLARAWALPGTEGLMHRIGGLEKENITGNVSYEPENHERMVLLRQAKIDKVAEYLPVQTIETGNDKGKVLVVGWGSTYGAIKTAVTSLLLEGYEIGHIHLRYINPFPSNLGDILKNFDKILVPELNNKQLVHLLRTKFNLDAIAVNKIQGQPFKAAELMNEIIKHYQ